MKRENWNVESYGILQQLGIRWVRSTNNEARVERNRSLAGTMELSQN